MLQYQVKLIRSNRKTLALEIREPGILLVRAPYLLQEERILKYLEEKESWIQKHMQQLQKQAEEKKQMHVLSCKEVRKLADRALAAIPPVVAHYAKIMGVTYGRITIRNQKTRWGSCSSKGNLNFNCLLMLAPTEVMEYVVVHELAHRIEMNHSERFWKIVESIKPDYKQAKLWLKEEGSKLQME